VQKNRICLFLYGFPFNGRRCRSVESERSPFSIDELQSALRARVASPKRGPFAINDLNVGPLSLSLHSAKIPSCAREGPSVESWMGPLREGASEGEGWVFRRVVVLAKARVLEGWRRGKA